MKRRVVFALAVLATATPVLSQQPGSTVQQDFEAATALQGKGDFAGALVRWQALEARTARNARSRAVVQVRKAEALSALDRPDEALAAARRGLADLPEGDASLSADRLSAFLTLAGAAESALDYASATQAYQQAEQIAVTPAQRLIALRGLIQTATFVDPAIASQAMKRANAALAATATDASFKAVLKRLNGQLLLNQGAFEASRLESAAAVRLLGGLTAATRIDDVPVRSNYAIAALLAGKKDEARKYMAMTGAGRLENGEFAAGSQLSVPECGGEAGLKRDDMAVVEFSIDDDGAVRTSTPVYAAGGGQVALEFARAARGWSWTTEQTRKIPPFFRHNVRLELRCATALERPSIITYLNGELSNWLVNNKVAMPGMVVGPDVSAVPQLRAQLAAAEAAQGRASPTLVPVLYQLIGNAAIGLDESNGFARRALAIAVANGAPPMARLAIEVTVWRTGQAESWKSENFVRALSVALATAPYSDDPVARTALRLMIADYGRKDEARTRQMLTATGAEAALSASHPLRVGALVRLASLEKASGNAPAAAEAFAQSGLSARQCALVDAAPRLLNPNTSPDKYPAEALGWGFDGWTMTQFDVSAEGRVVNERVIMAYPPFVFSTAATIVAKTARYDQSYRPDGGLGCGGGLRRVVFRNQM